MVLSAWSLHGRGPVVTKDETERGNEVPQASQQYDELDLHDRGKPWEVHGDLGTWHITRRLSVQSGGLQLQ